MLAELFLNHHKSDRNEQSRDVWQFRFERSKNKHKEIIQYLNEVGCVVVKLNSLMLFFVALSLMMLICLFSNGFLLLFFNLLENSCFRFLVFILSISGLNHKSYDESGKNSKNDSDEKYLGQIKFRIATLMMITKESIND